MNRRGFFVALLGLLGLQGLGCCEPKRMPPRPPIVRGTAVPLWQNWTARYRP